MNTIRSPSNYTINPLGANNILIGQYDSILDYASCIITCKGDQNMELILYQTIDKITVDETIYTIHAGVQEEIIIDLKYPYIKSTLRNLTSTAQTYLNYEMLYRQYPVSIPSSGNIGSNISDTNGNPIIAEGGILQVADTVAETSLASLVAGLSSTFNVDVVNFPEIQPISGGVNISDSAGFPITTIAGILQVADTVAEGNLASIVTGLSNPLVVDIHASNNDAIASTSGSVNTCLYDSAGSALNITSGAIHTVIDNSSIVITGSAGSSIGAQNGCMNVGLFDSTGTPLTLTSGALNVQTQSGLGLDSSLQTLINQNLDNGGALWNNATLVPNNTSSTMVNLTTKNSITYSYFGSCVPDTVLDSPVLTIQYSGDGSTWFPSPNVISLNVGGGNFSIDTISGAGYVNCVVSGLTTTASITMILNHI